MPFFRTLVLALAVLALVAAPRLAFAQQPDRATAVADMQKAMDEMRAHPSLKNMILGRIQSKAESMGVQDVQGKMTALGAKLDQAAALSDGDYAAQKVALANGMVDILKGSGTP